MNNDIRTESRVSAAVNHRKKYLGKKCKNCKSRKKYTSSGRCSECQSLEAKFKSDLIKVLLEAPLPATEKTCPL